MTFFQFTRLHQDRRDWSAAFIERGFNYNALGIALVDRFELKHLRLQQYRIEQLIDTLALAIVAVHE